MVSEDDNDDVYGDDDDGDTNATANDSSGYDMNKIYLSGGIMLGSVCIICAGLIFLSLCCFAGMKKRSDGLTDIEWCCYAKRNEKKKKTKKGHIAVGNDTDDEDIIYEDTMHMDMNE